MKFLKISVFEELESFVGVVVLSCFSINERYTDMSKQEQISLDTATSYDAGWNAINTCAAKYITALLGELHSIASISGLSQLSEDIQSVLTKHS